MSATDTESNLSTQANKKGKKILLSTTGSRGDVQPMLALAIELKKQGYELRLAAGPNLREFIESYGFEFSPYGNDLKKTEKQRREGTEEVFKELREYDKSYISRAFSETMEAAKDCDMIVVAGSYHHAGRSIAEALNIPFACLIFATVVVPSPRHPPTRMFMYRNQQAQSRPKSVNNGLWKSHEKEQNTAYLEQMNEARGKLDLPPIKTVSHFIMGSEPWLVADATLGPASSIRAFKIKQPGPLLLENKAPLSDEIEAFLQSGPAPIYVGFGSMLFTGNLDGESIVEACRASGYRAIIYRGWANIDIPEGDNDILAIGEHNQSKLFPRMAGIVHHGGAGTVTAAAIAGVPQIIVPNYLDQFYWAYRLKLIGIGFGCRCAYTISVDSLSGAIKELASPERVERAKEVSKQIELNGVNNVIELIRQALES